MDRLTPIIDYKARREEGAARTLREAVDVEQRQREAVEARKRELARERALCDDVSLSWMADLADAHSRQALERDERTLAATRQAVDDARGHHRTAVVEHRALLRLQDRRRTEARQHADRREQRALDELAMR